MYWQQYEILENKHACHVVLVSIYPGCKQAEDGLTVPKQFFDHFDVAENGDTWDTILSFDLEVTSS